MTPGVTPDADPGVSPSLASADDGAGVSRRTLGKYEILRRLAVGGMAEIFLARSTGIEGFVKHVVIKQILPQYACEDRFVSMFVDEARLAACLHHQNIAQVYDIGEDDGDYFFSMEYVHGEDVGTLLATHAANGERLPLGHALTVAAGIASGLAYAHEKLGPNGKPLGIVHRDISPSNILVSYDGGIKIVDFGIARAAIRSTETRTGAVKGKLSYMSPEQCLGDELDHRSDIFSLGVVLYELTTCSRLFRPDPEDSDYVVMNRIVTGKISRPTERFADYPPELEEILVKALAVDPNSRYQSARELLIDIEAFASQERISLSSASLSQYIVDMFGHRPEPWHDHAERSEQVVVGEWDMPRDDGFDDDEDFDDETIAEPPSQMMTGFSADGAERPAGVQADPSYPAAVDPSYPAAAARPASNAFGEPSASFSQKWFDAEPGSEPSYHDVRVSRGNRRRMAWGVVVALLLIGIAAGGLYAMSHAGEIAALFGGEGNPVDEGDPERSVESVPSAAEASPQNDHQGVADEPAGQPEHTADEPASPTAIERPRATPELVVPIESATKTPAKPASKPAGDALGQPADPNGDPNDPNGDPNEPNDSNDPNDPNDSNDPAADTASASGTDSQPKKDADQATAPAAGKRNTDTTTERKRPVKRAKQAGKRPRPARRPPAGQKNKQPSKRLNELIDTEW